MINDDFLTKEETYLFNCGEFYQSYRKFGAHKAEVNGKSGVHFAVWAPHALAISVAGSFNGWDGQANPMARYGSSGIWTLFIPFLEAGELYKYQLTCQDGQTCLKADPFALFSEMRPHTASVICDLSGYPWTDERWQQQRDGGSPKKKPLLIYEVHLGSWKRKQDNRFLNYRELARELIPYVKDLGFTHIELLPVMEHPYDGSWGYQITGYYAATSRYGSPHDLMFFIDQCHQAGIGVILDWVPGHFCKDAHGLGRFDGTPLYEKEEHRQWGTYKFDFSRDEVRSFLISNAVFWLDRYHVDGLRVDGVTSMLLLSYGQDDDKARNSHGGKEDLDAVAFLQKLNEVVFGYFPGALMIAEESTDWPLVSRPAYSGGLGFSYKWNMGWMNDTLRFFTTDFQQRKQKHRLLTFSLMYAFSEDFVLPLSHDEVVHGKKSLIEKMPGDYWQKFAGLRTLYLYLICHPGKKLVFMGGEFAQFIEWRNSAGLDWLLLDFETHCQHLQYVRSLNRLYLNSKELWENDHHWAGFKWIDADNSEQNVLIFLRSGLNKEHFLVIVINCRPNAYLDFRVGVPGSGIYREIFNSDAGEFGGSGLTNPSPLWTEAIPWQGQDYSLTIKIPPLAGIILRPSGKSHRQLEI